VNVPEDDGPLWRVIADSSATTSRTRSTPPAHHCRRDRHGRALPDQPPHRAPRQSRASRRRANLGSPRTRHLRASPTRPPPHPHQRQPAPDLLDDEYDAAKAGWLREAHPDAARYRAQGYRKVTDAIITPATRDQAEALSIKTGTWIVYRFQHWRHTQTQRVISLTSAAPAHLLGFFDRPDREPDAVHALDWDDEESWPYPHTDHPDQDRPNPTRATRPSPETTHPPRTSTSCWPSTARPASPQRQRPHATRRRTQRSRNRARNPPAPDHPHHDRPPRPSTRIHPHRSRIRPHRSTHRRHRQPHHRRNPHPLDRSQQGKCGIFSPRQTIAIQRAVV